MREIVLDTETTGLDPADGHRIVEIGAVELINQLPTGRTYHQYVNPRRPMPKEAFDVHGIGDEQLRSQPVFAAVGQAFLDFLGDAQMVIHNAAFDMKFLNYELEAAGLPILPYARATDTLMIARQKFPGASNTLDALCRRFGVNNSMREKHGALLDSELLAEVYLELIGSRQPDFGLGTVTAAQSQDDATGSTWRPRPRPEPLPPRITPEESAAHANMVAKLGAGMIWTRRS